MNYLQLKLHKLLNWEYWPFAVVYYPLFPIWFYYAFKARSLFFFNAANPSIKNGGMAMESKMEIYDLIPAQYIPKTILVNNNDDIDSILKKVSSAGISFPLIAKPDIGLKAFAVDKIQDRQELAAYQNRLGKDFLVQELITYPNEIGVFYVRFPNQNQGKITGIVSKEFLSVTGNGTDTIVQLIKNSARSYFQLPALQKKYGSYLDTILSSGVEFILVPYGSHTRGAKFIDVSHQINDRLLKTINSICTQVDGFYFGRLDIRYNTFSEIFEGKNFSIIEINGAGSEPTHIYDPNHSIFFAWKEIIRHWKYLYQISEMNFNKGHPYLSYKNGRKMLRANNDLEKQLKYI